MSTFTPSAEQAAIIDAPVDADVLVVAGAGSGKPLTDDPTHHRAYQSRCGT